MRFVASFIIMTVVAFVTFRNVSTAVSNAPESRHAVYNAIPGNTQAYYYGRPVRRPQSRIEKLVIDYLRAKVWLSLFSPRTTAVAPVTTATTSTSTSERTTTSTTTAEPAPEPAPETCRGLAGAPEAFHGWIKYKGCCYEAGENPATLPSNGAVLGASAICPVLGDGVVVAVEKVKTVDDRKALFVELLKLEGDVWVDLFEAGGLFWGDGSAYDSDGVTEFEGAQSQAYAATYSSVKPNVLTFRDFNYVDNGNTASYACEFCP